MAAIGRFVVECIKRSECTSLTITRGMRTLGLGQKRSTAVASTEWWVTAHMTDRRAVRSAGPTVQEALERTLLKLTS